MSFDPSYSGNQADSYEVQQKTNLRFIKISYRTQQLYMTSVIYSFLLFSKTLSEISENYFVTFEFILSKVRSNPGVWKPSEKNFYCAWVCLNFAE